MKSLAERNAKFWDGSKEQLKKYQENWYLDDVYQEKKVSSKLHGS